MQSWEIAPQALHLSLGWTGAGAEDPGVSERTSALKRIFLTSTLGKTELQAWSGLCGEIQALCFAWRVCLGLAQNQLTLDHVEMNWTQPSLKAGGGPGSGESVLLGSHKEQHYLWGVKNCVWEGGLGMKPAGDAHQLHHLVLLQGDMLS